MGITHILCLCTGVGIDEETKRVVASKCYLEEMRYHSFVQWLESELSQGRSTKGSIEIYKSKGSKTIIYKKNLWFLLALISKNHRRL